MPTSPPSRTALTATLATVRDHYAELFEAAPTLTSTLGNLVFTGDSDDPGDALRRSRSSATRSPRR